MLNTKPIVDFIAPPATAGGISTTPTTVTANGTASTTIILTSQVLD